MSEAPVIVTFHLNDYTSAVLARYSSGPRATTVDPDFGEWNDVDLPDVEDAEDEPPLIDNDPVPPDASDPDAA